MRVSAERTKAEFVSKCAIGPTRRRILHVVSSLERGGIELWLMQVCRRRRS